MNIYDENHNEDEGVAALTHEEYTAHKAACEAIVDKSDAAIKLSNNPEFIEIVMMAYLEDEPKRLGSIMASGKLTPKSFEDCVADLRSIGSMRGFLQDFVTKGDIARDELAGLEEAWNEAVEAGEV